jgi:hypothetical protein
VYNNFIVNLKHILFTPICLIIDITISNSTEQGPTQEYVDCWLVKKTPASYETSTFSTLSTKAFHKLIPSVSQIKSKPLHPISSKSISLLFSQWHTGLPNGLSSLHIFWLNFVHISLTLMSHPSHPHGIHYPNIVFQTEQIMNFQIM